MAVARGRWRRRLGPTSVAIMSNLQNLTQQNQAKSHTAPHDATANHSDWILQSLSASLTSDALRFGLRYEQMGYTIVVYLLSPASFAQRHSNFQCLPLNH